MILSSLFLCILILGQPLLWHSINEIKKSTRKCTTRLVSKSSLLEMSQNHPTISPSLCQSPLIFLEVLSLSTRVWPSIFLCSPSFVPSRRVQSMAFQASSTRQFHFDHTLLIFQLEERHPKTIAYSLPSFSEGWYRYDGTTPPPKGDEGNMYGCLLTHMAGRRQTTQVWVVYQVYTILRGSLSGLCHPSSFLKATAADTQELRKIH